MRSKGNTIERRGQIMKSKRDLLQSLVGNKNVVITALDGRGIVRVVSDTTRTARHVIDEVGIDMIHFVSNGGSDREGWIDIASVSEILIERPT